MILGPIRRCEGIGIPIAMLATLFSERGLFAPTCVVTSLYMEGIKNFRGWKFSRILPVHMLDQIGLRMKELTLKRCEIQGEIPGRIGHLKQLQTLDLSFTKVSGTIPNSIGDLKQL